MLQPRSVLDNPGTAALGRAVLSATYCRCAHGRRSAFSSLLDVGSGGIGASARDEADGADVVEDLELSGDDEREEDGEEATETGGGADVPHGRHDVARGAPTGKGGPGSRGAIGKREKAAKLGNGGAKRGAKKGRTDRR